MRLLPSFISKHLHQIYKKIEYKEHRLLYLFLELTQKCNLACRHCGSDCSSQVSAKELTTQSWLSIIDDLAKQFSPPPVLVLTGGEPVIHPDFQTIIEKIDSLGIRWGLVSNGYYLDENTVETFLDNNIQSITISLDGLKNNHNWLRGKSDSFVKTIKSLEIVASSKIPINDVVTCVNPKNLTDLDSLADLLLDLGISSWRLFRIFPAGRAKNKSDLLLSVKDTKKMIDWVFDNKKKLSKKGLDVNLSCEGWLPFKLDQKVRSQPFFCRSGVNIASILSDGTITGCSNNAGRFYEGNILNDNFAYLWKNKFEKFRDRKWVNDTSCGLCQYVKFCGGSSIHLWRGNLNKPEFCYMDCYDK